MNMIMQIPVPKDISLPLPLPGGVLMGILIFSFLLHILFINLMLGSTILTFWFQLKGVKDSDYDVLAREIAATITVNKSMGVVLGVAPLLSINVLYTIYFYSANAMTGYAWISIVPWVALAFLLLYLHKYTWDRFAGNRSFHIAILSLPMLSFLVIPFIFLTNINLMLFPERWNEVHGFLSALALPNVFPRYFHFLAASLALTGLFLFIYFGRKTYTPAHAFNRLQQTNLQQMMLNLTLGATGAQLIFGPLLFLTLPSKGVSWSLFFVIVGGVVFALAALVLMWRMQVSGNMAINRRFMLIVASLTVTVGFMGTGRHIYRENALRTHKELMAARTKTHQEAAKKARENLPLPKETQELLSTINPGQELFQSHCAVCHAAATRLVGPPMTEASAIYAANPEALKKWIKAPGRKRPDYPQMTGFPQLTDQQLTDLSAYVLGNKWN